MLRSVIPVSSALADAAMDAMPLPDSVDTPGVRHLRSLIGALTLSLSFVLVPALAHAQNPTRCIDRLSPAELDVRLDLVDNHFQANKRRARAHWYGFMSLFAALGVGQVILGATTDEKVERFSNIVGASGAFLVTAQMAVLPNMAALAPQRYRRHPASTLDERRLKLRYGLELMELAARRTRLGSGPGSHVLPLVWSAVWSTTIMLKFDSPLTVLRLVGGGILFTEARILLAPHGAVRSWESLRGSMCSGTYLHRYTPTEMEEMLPPEEEPEEDDGSGEPMESWSPSEGEGVTTGGVSLSGVYFLHTF